MDIKKLNPIPKNILEQMKRLDKKLYLFPESTARFYSYLTSIDRELVKVTVAVKTVRDVFYNKQVAVHGIRSKECFVKDLEYNHLLCMGYKTGWYDQFLYFSPKDFEDGKWYPAKRQYYNPYSTLINASYLNRFPKYKYSAYKLFNGKCILEYLRVYEKYPETELLLKLGLSSYLATKKSLLNKLKKDKLFRKWLTENIADMRDSFFKVSAILSAYKNNISILKAQKTEQERERLKYSYCYGLISKVIGDEWLKFFNYLEEHNISANTYYDYALACDYLHLDMTLNKNRFPKDFMRFHDIRIDEYHTAKALADAEEKKKYMEKFIDVANKYLPLQRNKNEDFICVIARTPEELVKEGEYLDHCVGRMNYDQRIAKEQSLIFFIRKAVNPDKPFVTVEYSLSTHKVLQCYGRKDSKPEDNVLRFVNDIWLPYANRKIKKLQKTA